MNENTQVLRRVEQIEAMTWDKASGHHVVWLCEALRQYLDSDMYLRAKIAIMEHPGAPAEHVIIGCPNCGQAFQWDRK